jgi:uncharacterized DUF497 family protein
MVITIGLSSRQRLIGARPADNAERKAYEELNYRS